MADLGRAVEGGETQVNSLTPGGLGVAVVYLAILAVEIAIVFLLRNQFKNVHQLAILGQNRFCLYDFGLVYQLARR
jgi:hypothetical protein